MPLNTIKHLARLQKRQFHSLYKRTLKYLPIPLWYQSILVTNDDAFVQEWPSRDRSLWFLSRNLWNRIIYLYQSVNFVLQKTGAGVEIRGPSSLIGNTTTVPTCPILCSVTASNMLPSSENSTRFTAVGNSQVCKHIPSCTFHNLIVLSALPVANNVEVAKHSVHVQGETQLQKWDLSELGGCLRLTWTVHTAP